MKRSQLKRKTPLRSHSTLKKVRPISKKTRVERLLKKAWALHSEYARKKAKGECYTCGVKKDWREMDAGHYIHGRLDHHPNNIRAQCTRCNRFLHGNLGRYAERLLAEIGPDAFYQIRLEANQVKKWEVPELEEKIRYYEKAIQDLDGQSKTN